LSKKVAVNKIPRVIVGKTRNGRLEGYYSRTTQQTARSKEQHLCKKPWN